MKDFVVRTKETVFGSFETYSEAFAFWKTVRRQHPGAVIQDNSR
jgi:hypothetical protein